jgi:hypothetical protein
MAVPTSRYDDEGSPEAIFNEDRAGGGFRDAHLARHLGELSRGILETTLSRGTVRLPHVRAWIVATERQNLALKVIQVRMAPSGHYGGQFFALVTDDHGTADPV